MSDRRASHRRRPSSSGPFPPLSIRRDPHALERARSERQIEHPLLGLLEPTRVPDPQPPPRFRGPRSRQGRLHPIRRIEDAAGLEADDLFEQPTSEQVRRRDAVQDLMEARNVGIEVRLDPVNGHQAARGGSEPAYPVQGREQVGDVDTHRDGGALSGEGFRERAAAALLSAGPARDPDPAFMRVRRDQPLGPVVASSLDQAEHGDPPLRQARAGRSPAMSSAAQRVGGPRHEQEAARLHVRGSTGNPLMNPACSPPLPASFDHRGHAPRARRGRVIRVGNVEHHVHRWPLRVVQDPVRTPAMPSHARPNLIHAAAQQAGRDDRL